jgi:flagellar basal-body rod protein FlgF
VSSTIDLITASLRADADTLRIVSQNIANAQSVAYLREIPLNHIPGVQGHGAPGAPSIGTGHVQEFARTLESSNATGSLTADTARLNGALDAGEVATALDLRPGTLRSTANPLHLALESQGFFVVQTAQGTMFTRRGDFRLDSDGRLVTQSGDPVQGSSGDINVGAAGQPTIAADGTVRAGTDVVGKLRIVQVGSATSLQPMGNGLYSLASGEETTEATAPIVHQGFLETSNIQTVNEMIQLMETMRRFESGQRFVRGYDDMMDKTIATLGRI